ncbi:RHS repeat domain-containing protein [Terriglobus saanensis]|uniref:YD repeat protein n=1 Tax=Terriglobus saanensis (strain ATCC BAA-1853 / DSM 23119 / SP1PR4) TaxID=401053 RepID=E8V6Q9_TERSS|nr:RHS repeat-associated core domain-containing protein [Terriglobus saanensis]ADV83861.1 YD repeat protein [Terriglobus saanensis SP1PR4]
MPTMRKILPALAFILLQSVVSLWAQSPITPANETGLPADGVYSPNDENINLTNGNVQFTLPLVSLPGRAGHDLHLNLVFNSKALSPTLNERPFDPVNETSAYGVFGGWQLPNWFTDSPIHIPQIVASSNPVVGQDVLHDAFGQPSGYVNIICSAGYVYLDETGAPHSFGNITNCMGDIAHPELEKHVSDAYDGSLYRLDFNNGGLFRPDGSQLRGNQDTDKNGNVITYAFDGFTGNYSIKDTVGRTVTITTSSNPITDSKGQLSPGSTTDWVVTYKGEDGQDRTISIHRVLTSDPITLQATCTDSVGESQNTTSTLSPLGSIYTVTFSGSPSRTYTLTLNGMEELTRVNYPTGGYVRYEYTDFPGSEQVNGAYVGITCSNMSHREVSAKYFCSNSSGRCSPEVRTTYTPTIHTLGLGENSGIDVRNSDGRTHVDFIPMIQHQALESNRVIYQGESTPLQAISTQYDTAEQKSQVTTTLYSGGQPQVATKATYGYFTKNFICPQYPYSQTNCNETPAPGESPIVTSEKIFGFDGALIRDTETTPTGYEQGLQYNWSLISSQTVTGTGGGMAKTDNEYDVYSNGLAVTGADSSTHIQVGNYRGNLTRVRRYTLNGTGPIDSLQSYDDTGNVVATTDPLGHVTNFHYQDAWSSLGCAPSSSNEFAYLTQVQDALQHTSNFRYNFCTGTRLEASDLNNNWTTTSYDNFARVNRISFPDGGWQQFSRSDSAPAFENVQIAENTAGQTINKAKSFDGLGRVLTATTTESGSSQIYTADYGYDNLGRISTAGNPYRLTDSSFATTSYTYDSLGRKTLQTQPDGSTQQWSYNGSQTVFTDETGHTWSRNYDALGRLGNVIEPTGASTGYVYDSLGNLTTATQTGVAGDARRSRSFTYDSLSRLITATNPETGTICYGTWTSGICSNGYDANGNLMAKTDARGATATYGYDALNRLTSKSRLGASTDLYFYDGLVGTWGATSLLGGNLVGHLSFIRSFNPDLAGNTCDINSRKNCDDQYFGYDNVGRLNHWTGAPPSEWGSTSHSINTTYDLTGNPLRISYPDGRTLRKDYDAAGRLTAVTDESLNKVMVSAMSYFPNGAVQSLSYGNGVVEKFGQNNRLQTCTDVVTQGSNTYLNKTYHFQPNATGACGSESSNNGNIWSIADGTAGALYSQSMSYDSLNRLISWTGPNFVGMQQMAYGYDSFGNMTQVPGTQALAPSVDYDANNRYLRGGSALEARFSCVGANGETTGYDAAGNLLCWGTPNSNAQAYTWDAESRMSRLYAAQNSTLNLKALYSYDAMGARVRADQLDSSGHSISFREYSSFGGELLSEKDQNGWWTDYIFANGKKIARVDPNNVYRWMIADQVGTSQLELDASGTLLWKGEFLPFGQEPNPAATTNRYKFTGKERDAESGLDNFGARYYASSLGRFMSPDWADSPSPVPWVLLANPQSLNLYSYVNNNPMTRRDEDGHATLCGPDLWNSQTNTLTSGSCVDLPDPLTRGQIIRQTHDNFMNWRNNLAVNKWLSKKLNPRSVESAQWAVLLAEILESDLGLASDEIEDLTKPGSIDNKGIKLTPDQIGAKLQDGGFTKSAASDGTPVYVKGDRQYTVYSQARSTDGPSAQVKDNGSVVGKVRLK